MTATITIDRAALAAALRTRGRRLGDYAEHVVTAGHVPGVLSGAELKGTARSYAGHYSKRRQAVAGAIAALTNGAVSAGTPRGASRKIKVWIADGEAVELRLG